MSDIHQKLRERLRDLRETNGFTQETVAEKADISYKHYQNIESGRRTDIKLATVEKLAKAYDMEVSDLLRFD